MVRMERRREYAALSEMMVLETRSKMDASRKI